MKLLMLTTLALLAATITAKDPPPRPCTVDGDRRCGKKGKEVLVCKSGNWERLEDCGAGYICEFDSFGCQQTGWP